MNTNVATTAFGELISADIASHFEQTEELSGTDAEIAAAVGQAELPPLLAALFVLTGNPDLIAEDLKPPLPPLLASGAPHGGMGEAAVARGREIATKVLIDARDNGWPTIQPKTELLRAAFKHLTKKDSEDFMAMIGREFGLPSDSGKPHWTKEEIAPHRRFKVVVIGGGMAGVASAYRLSQANVPFIVLEKNARPGGVWNDNRYPGCRLDTPNFAYGFSFAPKSDWPQQFSRQQEILKYVDEVVTNADLYANFQFNTEVIRMEYSAVKGGWTIVVMHDGVRETIFANAVISAVGHLNRPNIPNIPGSETFQGRAFHSAEWPDGVDLRGKRVAVLGTGASGFQIVPAIAESVEHMTVFQRNAAWMLSTPNYHDDVSTGMLKLLKSVPYYGRWFRLWQFVTALDARFPAVEVEEGWKDPISVGSLNHRLMQDCLSLLEKQCGDRKDLLKKLTPTYPPGAKRMARDNGAYLKALKRPNVSLVTEPIERITPKGLVTSDGVAHDVDFIIYATGFHASAYMEPIEVIGENGVPVHDFWEGDGRAYLGISVPGYPNLFMIGGPNSGLVVNGNAIVTTEYALHYILGSIEFLLKNDCKSIDVKENVYSRYNEEVDRDNRKRAWGVATVNTWYQGKNGRAAVPWPYPILEYFRRTAQINPADFVTKPIGEVAE